MLKKIALATSLAFVANSNAAQEQRSPAQHLDTFEKLFGVTEGKRRNHTKGFCFEGEFMPLDTSVRELSNSPIFSGTSKVYGRVSHKGGKANPPDNTPGHYGLAFQITTSDNSLHMMSMNTEHFFPTSTVADFMAFLEAQANGPEATKAFVKDHPEIQEYKQYHAALSNQLHPYEGATYNSINTFYLVNEQGKKTPVRWSFVPSGEHDIVKTPQADFFLDNMQANIKNGGVSWDMVLTLASQGDDILNPHVKWSDDNKSMTVARLTVNKVMTESEGTCANMNFDPLAISKGFAPSEDPMLAARSAIYAVGLGRRLSEQ
ncbi:catalase-related peroxidase [Vibrio zhanjiangensis]|uniref:Catalase-related peroxidase n=1 Tax=Vibrio zhanjiangensis TaxID=1046128 RepID=A0ABQ6ETA1_9VIBR|nr:catalase [Vibrio zhanjiangensis]GLT16378.1 catalase-related peroxidase [Vibrio zhanjiangensis]